MIRLLLVASVSFAGMNVLVSERPDGGVTVWTPVCKAAERMTSCLDRLKPRCLYSCEKFDRANLPSRKKRNRWRIRPTPGAFEVFVDTSLPKTDYERVAEMTEVLKSTSTTKQQKLDAMLDIEIFKARRNNGNH